MKLHRSPALLLGLILSALVACGDDTSATAKPSCDAIVEACHPSTTPDGIDCHEFSEDAAATEDQCAARKDECLAACESAAGGGGTGGANTGGTSAGGASSGGASVGGAGGAGGAG